MSIMASMRDIKRRKSSIQSTQQITKAMKLVSTVKLQRARNKAETSKPYFSCMYDTVTQTLARCGNINHPYINKTDGGKKAIILISSNRGLAGGYNSNVAKLITRGDFHTEDVQMITIGKKGRDAVAKAGFTVKADYSDVIEEPTYADAMEISRVLLESFAAGDISEIYVAYTAFKNTVVHEPTLVKLLPIEADQIEKKEETTVSAPMEFEPEEEEAIDMIVPKYITSLIYGAMVEAVASENGARMQAMDNATSNAEEMISSLSLLYNRARQGSITQELTEIIAGASAIS